MTLSIDSSLSMRLSAPAEVEPLPKDVNGAPTSGNINFPAVDGMLLYLNIAFAVHQVARYTFKPVCHHKRALVQIGRYLKSTKD
ncbi:hypothetical protein ACHAW6_002282 [Cyclotella cf. meneghiniana]